MQEKIKLSMSLTPFDFWNRFVQYLLNGQFTFRNSKFITYHLGLERIPVSIFSAY